MKRMIDLDFGKIGSKKEIVLKEDLLLDDSAFSNRPLKIAKAGETVKLLHEQNFGVVIHKVHGIFRI